MRWILSTVSYRYHLYSMQSIATLAMQNGFSGLELWEPHLNRHREEIRAFVVEKQFPIYALSGYLDLTDWDQCTDLLMADLEHKLKWCSILNIPLLRLFSGSMSSHEAASKDWTLWFERLVHAEQLAQQYDVNIAFETHPGTLLDSQAGVERFLAGIDKYSWKRIGLNFDVYHVWEFGLDPEAYFMHWFPYVKHVHLKNACQLTNQFHIHNVYHPAGRFDELTSLEAGIIEIKPIIEKLKWLNYQGAATIEWFGATNDEFFQRELTYLNGITAWKMNRKFLLD